MSLKGLDYEPRIYTNWVDTCVALNDFWGASQGVLMYTRLNPMGDCYVTVSRWLHWREHSIASVVQHNYILAHLVGRIFLRGVDRKSLMGDPPIFFRMWHRKTWSPIFLPDWFLYCHDVKSAYLIVCGSSPRTNIVQWSKSFVRTESFAGRPE